MHFTKMQAAGNDFIVLDLMRERPERLPDPARLCRRRTGIGADGVVLLEPPKRPDTADISMRIFNPDGSEAQMCGNGIRCVGKYVYEKGIKPKFHLAVETKAGLRALTLKVHGGRVEAATVDMGRPVLYPWEIPADFPGQNVLMQQLMLVGGDVYPVTCVSMGNPHAVIFTDEPETVDLADVGARIEDDPHFPERTNVEFAVCESRSRIRMRVWERGVGETLSCGTGACAVAVAAAANHLTDEEVSVQLKGGRLFVRWDRWNGRVWLTGDAAFVFEGEF